MCGFDVVSVPSTPDGYVDVRALRDIADDTVAGLMLTNPNTLGKFEKDICQISEIIHEVGGLLYYDGANLNAIMGVTRPGDMGFDVVHWNLHKTLSTPHGGGGPGSGPVGCKELLREYLPVPVEMCIRDREDILSTGSVYEIEVVVLQITSGNITGITRQIGSCLLYTSRCV